MERNKVLWLIKGLGAGGAEKLLTGAIPYLDRQTFQYEVAYLLPGKNDLVPEFQQAGIPVFCLGAGKAYDLRVGVRLVRLLRQREVDLLHMHLPTAGIIGRIAGRLGGVKAVVYTEHSILEVYHPLTAFMDRLTYPLDDMTIAVSDAVRQSMLRGKIFRPRRVRTIVNGVRVDGGDVKSVNEGEIARIRASLGIPETHSVVGTVSHIRPEKGHRYLIQAAQRVLDCCPDTTFVIVGRENVKGAIQELESYALHLGIKDRVIFTGFRKDAAQVMSAFDVFVLPSLVEGLPVALLEAMALGKPPVATCVGGVSEVITDGVDGLMVAPRDHDALAQQVITLLKDPELRKTMSAKTPVKIQQKFTAQSMVRSVEEVYTEVLGQR